MAYNPPVEPENTPKDSTQYKNSSNFGSINNHLLVRIRRCDDKGNLIEGETDQVTALGLEGDLGIDNQYTSPFENSNPEQKLPTLLAQLQSGNWAETFDIIFGTAGSDSIDSTQEKLRSLKGHTSLTKENSTQIFTSTNPVSMPFSLYFETWENAKTEVEDQLDLLKMWSLPEELSDQSLLASFVQEKTLESLFPSKVPPFVAVYYGGKRYAPLLIQTYSESLTMPKDSEGNRMFVTIPVNFLSREAWDKNNISKLYLG
nr:hypothetical protein [Acinetobacter oleivorans]